MPCAQRTFGGINSFQTSAATLLLQQALFLLLLKAHVVFARVLWLATVDGLLLWKLNILTDEWRRLDKCDV